MQSNIIKQERLKDLFGEKKKVLSIYYTAGFPELTDTVPIAIALENAGVQMIEIGMPYSDPIADGPTIQKCSDIALKNGMSIHVLLEQLKELRVQINIPILLMGYLNPILQFGIIDFLDQISAIGVDGLIIPDLPLDEYKQNYKTAFEERGISNVLLISPQTSDKRIREIDTLTTGFLYLVSSNATTGAQSEFNDRQINYFKRIDEMNLENPSLIGFGISSATQVQQSFEFHSGCIIGSAFLKALQQSNEPINVSIPKFIQTLQK